MSIDREYKKLSTSETPRYTKFGFDTTVLHISEYGTIRSLCLLVFILLSLYVTEELQEAALYCKIDNIDPKAEIETIDVLKQIVSKFGYRMRIVPAPSSNKTIEKVY